MCLASVSAALKFESQGQEQYLDWNRGYDLLIIDDLASGGLFLNQRTISKQFHRGTVISTNNMMPFVRVQVIL